MAAGHIRRMAAVNHDRTFSGVSRLMYACTYTFIHSHCPGILLPSPGSSRDPSGNLVSSVCQIAAGGNPTVEPVVGLWEVLWKFKKSSRALSGTRGTFPGPPFGKRSLIATRSSHRF